MTASQALQHPCLLDAFQEMQRARQGMPECHYLRTPPSPADLLDSAVPVKARRPGLKAAKGIFKRTAKFVRHPLSAEKRKDPVPVPADLDWFFPPYVMPNMSNIHAAPAAAAAAPQHWPQKGLFSNITFAPAAGLHDSAHLDISLTDRFKGVRAAARDNPFAAVPAAQNSRFTTAQAAQQQPSSVDSILVTPV